MIGKWLHAGVLEEGRVSYPEAGSPQGGVVSPMLSNIYLHYVLDEWIERQVRPCMKAQIFLIRYADDFVIGFADEQDARRVMEVLPKRYGKYGLTLHPDKTRLVPFRKPSAAPTRKGPGSSDGPGSFDLLGFTHYWGVSRKGAWVVKRKTAGSRMARALWKIAQWCRIHRHRPVREQHQALCQKVRGHLAYYGMTGNASALSSFRHWVAHIWRKWLSRRKRGRPYPWVQFRRLLERYPLPYVTLPHSVYRRVANSVI